MSEARHPGEVTQRFVALDYVEAGSRGARFGSYLGAPGAMGGAVVGGVGLFVWDKWHKEILSALCGK